MDNEERLKEFKQYVDFLDDSIDMEDYYRFRDTLENLYADGELLWIHRYAKGQNKRVQELEGYKESYEGMVRALDNMSEMLIDLEQQNIRYRDYIEKAIQKNKQGGIGSVEHILVRALEGELNG